MPIILEINSLKNTPNVYLLVLQNNQKQLNSLSLTCKLQIISVALAKTFTPVIFSPEVFIQHFYAFVVFYFLVLKILIVFL